MRTSTIGVFSKLLALASIASSASAFLSPGAAKGTSSDAASAPLHLFLQQEVAKALAVGVVGLSFATGAPSAALADGSTSKFALPPVNRTERDRCSFKSSAMGQANAARDKLYDLRECDMSGKSAGGGDLSGVIASEADFTKVDFKEATMSKAYARNSKFDGADFTNGVIDRVSFDGSSLRGAIFKNTVLTSTSFKDADVEGADFTEAYLGDFDLKNLCRNPTLKGTNPTTGEDTRDTVGCK